MVDQDIKNEDFANDAFTYNELGHFAYITCRSQKSKQFWINTVNKVNADFQTIDSIQSRYFSASGDVELPKKVITRLYKSHCPTQIKIDMFIKIIVKLNSNINWNVVVGAHETNFIGDKVFLLRLSEECFNQLKDQNFKIEFLFGHLEFETCEK